MVCANLLSFIQHALVASCSSVRFVYYCWQVLSLKRCDWRRLSDNNRHTRSTDSISDIFLNLSLYVSMPSCLAQFVYFSQSADLYIYYFYLCLSAYGQRNSVFCVVFRMYISLSLSISQSACSSACRRCCRWSGLSVSSSSALDLYDLLVSWRVG